MLSKPSAANLDFSPPSPLGESDAFLEFQERLSRVAKVDRPVLLLGERGTGKEIAARQLHFLSKRWEHPFCELNCAALAPGLIESELFGHEAGAFTGATLRRRGRFEAADGGTLFLDELGNLPLPVQEKILRVVEYGSFERVGGSERIRADVRIVGATNADLVAMSARGAFMRDLLDRLSFEALVTPPLRARGDDVLLLANHFAARMAFELDRDAPEFTMAAQRALLAHPWHGNVRELKNVVERAVYRAEGDRIDALVFDPFDTPYYAGLRAQGGGSEGSGGAGRMDGMDGGYAMDVHEAPGVSGFACPIKDLVAAYEARLVQAALKQCRFNQRDAAAHLGLTYNQFRGLYRKHAAAIDLRSP